MKETDGVGLAANQIGLDAQMIVVDTGREILKLINPRITKRKGSIVFEEGCLSFPDILLKPKRSKKVSISCLNEQGEKLNFDAEGILAVVFQHEIDHINGILFIDRIPLWGRMRVAKKLKKIKEARRQVK